VKCDDTCETCHGQGRTDCTKCQAGLIFKNFKCEEPPSNEEVDKEDEQLINGDPLTEAEARKLHEKLTEELNSEEKDSIQYMVYQALVILTIVSIVAIVLYKYNLPPVSWFVRANQYTIVQTDEF